MMTRKFLCISAAVALLFSSATTNAVYADETALNEAVTKIEAVGKMIADLKLVAVEADAAANQAGTVLVDAVRAAARPTPAGAPFGYARTAYPALTAPPVYYASPVYYAPPAYYAPYPYYRCGLFSRVVYPRCSYGYVWRAPAYTYPYYGYGYGWW